MSEWAVWKKNQALAKVGDGWMDLYGNNTWSYYESYEDREKAEAAVREIRTMPTMEEWLKLDFKGPGGMCVVDAICRPVGHNPNWEGG